MTLKSLKIMEMPVVERPREKMVANGESHLTNRELLQVVLGSGMRGNDVRRIAEHVDSLLVRSGGHPKLDELMAIRGVGRARALKLLACVELVERYVKLTGKRIVNEEDVLPLLEDIRHRKQEHFMVITLDGANRVIERRVVTVGTINASLVHPREVFADAITDRAASIVVAHNHPGGTLEPSAADLEVTRRLRDAGKLLGIQLFDHIIVTAGAYCTVEV
jgi:DNA repair protein RadC